MSLVVPAVLPATREELEEKLALLTHIPSVSRVQIDVVDGKFAAPASFPYSAPAEFKAMVQNGEMLPHLDRVAYEIDLMCFDGERTAGAWLAQGATRLTFHAAAARDLPRLLAFARGRYGAGGGFTSCLISLGLALNIASDLALIETCLGDIAYVQFMGIAQMGKQAEPFDERVFEKVRIFHARHPDIPIQVDGGISFENAKKLLALGVSNLIIGSGILRARDPAAAFAAFEALEGPLRGIMR
jgi:ribulose-phosphate 3-epimerase